MWLSDTSIKRPVFATVLSLMLIAFGVLSFYELSLREYPDITPPVVSINTTYVGASADVVESTITQRLEEEISGIAGINSITSSSRDGRSNITVEFNLDRDLDDATNDVRDKVTAVQNQLPEDSNVPRISKREADPRPILWMSFLNNTGKSQMEMTDYLDRNVVDRLAVISGVSEISFPNGSRPSMRIWIDRLALAARNLTVIDIENTLYRENIELPAGRLDSKDKEFTARIARNYQTAEDFRAMVIKRGDDGHFIRLGEVAEVEVAPRDIRTVSRTNGQDMISMGIVKQSTANTLEVLDAVKKEISKINAELPDGMSVVLSSDASVFIREAISKVYYTIGQTTFLVGLVILVFLGSFRAMIIPVLTIPICLTASFFILAALGYSINLITLLALVLSIGLVVDDAIVVLENVHRRIDEGEEPLLAAINGTRQVGFAVIATTVVLIAMFAPIAFLKDNIGRIFSELAITISAAVIFSSILALSLVPMLCSKLLRPSGSKTVMSYRVNNMFNWIAGKYQILLNKALRYSWTVVIILVLTGFGAYQLFNMIPQEYAPSEDQGEFISLLSAAEGTSYTRMEQVLLPQIEEPILPLVKTGEVERAMFRIPGFNNNINSGFSVIKLSPWDKRTQSTDEIMQEFVKNWNQIPGVRMFAFARSGLSRGGGGRPVQFVVGGPNYEELVRWRDIILRSIERYPGMTRIDTDLKENQPQVEVRIKKDRAAELGVSLQTIGRTLSAMMSDQPITTYVVNGEEYDVVIQAKDEQRATPDDMSNIYVRSDRTGELIPLSNLITVEVKAGVGNLYRYNRYRALTISANLVPGFVLGDALNFLENVINEELPESAHIDYKGQSKEYKESSRGIFFTLAIALLVVFLVLSAQFESFIHPVIIMVTVPLAILGAMLGLIITDSTINIFSQVGIVMLVGIAAKNGILIVEFINQLREQGMKFEEAIVNAARIRFRPVMMTTFSTLMGSLPLLFGTGAGSESRNLLGIVLFSGVLFATLFTLFVVPLCYHLIARNTASRNAIFNKLEKMQVQIEV